MATETLPDGARAQTFESILYERGGERERSVRGHTPEYFHDLNLDQILDAITHGKDEYDLRPFFYDSLRDLDAILYRQEVMRDLEEEAAFACIVSFADGMRLMRQQLAQAEKLHYTYNKEAWCLRAIATYLSAVRALEEGLRGLNLTSRGLRSFHGYLSEYLASERFTGLAAQVGALSRDLQALAYSIHIKGSRFEVRNYDSEPNYSDEIAATFAKFRRSAAKNYLCAFTESVDMNHVEEIILGFVARFNPEPFRRLDEFCTANREFADALVGRFDREIQFYMAYLGYAERFKKAGLAFCYPTVSARDKDVYDRAAFDLALATKLFNESAPIVCNDFRLDGPERVLVVSGPNQGGKTTFARAFGQVHHFASIGCPVPGSSARLFLFDSIFTHFEKQERVETLRGKLQDDLIRFRDILDRATPRSIIIMNEVFSSTSLEDAVFLARRVLDKIVELDAICVCVTFLDELASLNEKTVSMVSVVNPTDPTKRTYKVLRRPADGRAYALSIAEKYGLTYEQLKARLPSGTQS
jgi:DNA mismatch repair protein MutS